MYHFNDLDMWRLRREELIREAESERLVRRPGRPGSPGLFVATLVAAVLLLMLVAAGPSRAATTFTVNSVSDAGDTNLTDGANDTPGADVIDFNILGTGVKTISPTSGLPAITEAVTVDGYSQPGASPNTSAKSTNARLLVELDRTNAATLTDGLFINASNVVVRGLVINRFDTGVVIFSSGGPTDNNRIEGNFIGPDPTGTLGSGNGFGVEVLDGENNTVGGTSPASRNLIGTERDGKSPPGNADEGVDVFGAEAATVGGATSGAANIIAFNEEEGVLVGGGSSTVGNRILRNAIFSNGELGIDLGDVRGSSDGPTANDPADADSGANGLQNKPVITSARASERATTIEGKLSSTPRKTFTIQPFSNPGGDAEGKKFLGQKSVTTGASGDVSFSFKKKVRKGTITATATNDATGDTSEFSAPRKVRRA
jgi:hypothetical protein